ncbi:DUF6341 family protein [Altibacter sp. HG106]|uniref:DUF6341 family protein n=1 Tax=Altibacter sp. HG106 TaxID=3023937 RepID=UPI0023508D91|nr:uracil phosphoribosyltransferase [Altibacter sp. HG106]MDC7995018.1 uracil phosphoribosyltransferase [Altibacter sp. HG106]
MEWKDVFYAIEDLFVNVLFVPYDALRSLELDSWWAANIMSWLFMAIGFVAFLYWMKELKTFNDNNEEDRSQTSHSFLG